MAGIIVNAKSRTMLNLLQSNLHNAQATGTCTRRALVGIVGRKVAIFSHGRYYTCLIERHPYAKAFAKFACNNDPIIFHCEMLLTRHANSRCFPRKSPPLPPLTAPPPGKFNQDWKLRCYESPARNGIALSANNRENQRLSVNGAISPRISPGRGLWSLDLDRRDRQVRIAVVLLPPWHFHETVALTGNATSRWKSNGEK